MEAAGFELRCLDVRDRAGEILQLNHGHNTPYKDHSPGHNWFSGFVKRHQGLWKTSKLKCSWQYFSNFMTKFVLNGILMNLPKSCIKRREPCKTSCHVQQEVVLEGEGHNKPQFLLGTFVNF